MLYWGFLGLCINLILFGLNKIANHFCNLAELVDVMILNKYWARKKTLHFLICLGNKQYLVVFVFMILFYDKVLYI